MVMSRYPNQALKGMSLRFLRFFLGEYDGSLEVGKKADFVVFDRDIMRVTVEDILRSQVVATVVDGGCFWEFGLLKRLEV